MRFRVEKWIGKSGASHLMNKPSLNESRNNRNGSFGRADNSKSAGRTRVKSQRPRGLSPRKNQTSRNKHHAYLQASLKYRIVFFADTWKLPGHRPRETQGFYIRSLILVL